MAFQRLRVADRICDFTYSDLNNLRHTFHLKIRFAQELTVVIEEDPLAYFCRGSADIPLTGGLSLAHRKSS